MILNRPLHLERVNERFILELSLILDSGSPLHVGAGSEGTSKMLLKIIVNGRELPVIPAESLKGVLRSLAFSLSKQMFPDNLALSYHVKDRHVKREGVKQEEIIKLYGSKSKEELVKILPKDAVKEMSEGDPLQLIEYYFALNCPVCRLFGAQGMAGKLTFSDGVPNVTPKLLSYTLTSINRKTRIVEEGRLFSLIAVKPDENLRYNVKIIVDNVCKGSEEAKLLAALLHWIVRFGLQVGGLKSRGYGRLFVDKDKSLVKLLRFTDVHNEDDLLSNVRALLLKNGYFKEMKVEEFTKWLVNVYITSS